MLTTTVQGRTWNFSHAIGWNAIAGNGFTQPFSVTFAGSDIIYVLNRGGENVPNRRIGKWTSVPNVDEEFIRDFGREDFTWPVALAVSSKRHVYCTDEHENRVIKWDSEGEKLGEWGNSGGAEGELYKPSGIAFDSEDNLYVVDAGNHRVQKFTSEGSFLLSWGSLGSGEGEFRDPWGITVDRSGSVYIADWGNNRVQKFTEVGDYIQSFGVAYPDELKLNHPSDVAVDSDGDVYIVDWGNKRVQICDNQGEILTCLYGDAVEFSKSAKDFLQANPDFQKAFNRAQDTTSLGLFERPVGIAIDENDRIIISETVRCRLQVYVKEKNFMDPQYNL